MASLVELIKKSNLFEPTLDTARSAKDALVADTLRKQFGKDYLDSFTPDFDPKKDSKTIIKVKPESENPFIANRDHEGLSRRFNQLTRVERDTSRDSAYEGIASDPVLVERIRQERRVNFLSAIRKAKAAHDKSYPIVADILDWKLDSIIQETGRFYDPTKKEAVTKFEDAKRHISSVVDSIKDPDVFKKMATDGLKNKSLVNKLKKYPELFDAQGAVDPAKLASTIEFSYLNDDHQNPGKIVQFDEDRSKLYTNAILKAVFGKKNLLTRKSVLDSIHATLKNRVNYIQERVYELFSEPEHTPVREELWNIITQDGKRWEKMDRFYRLDIKHDEEISSQIEKYYSGVIWNDSGDEQVRYVEDGRKDVLAAKISKFWQVIDQYDGLKKELNQFEADFINKPVEKNVYERLTERLGQSIYTDRTPETNHEHALRYLKGAGKSKEVVKMLEGHTKTKLAKMDVNDMLEKMYFDAMEVIVERTDPELSQALDTYRRSRTSRVTDKMIDAYHSELFAHYHERFPNTAVNQKVKPFLALYQIQQDLRTLN